MTRSRAARLNGGGSPIIGNGKFIAKYFSCIDKHMPYTYRRNVSCLCLCLCLCLLANCPC
jgi:hypothetical protein